MKSRECPCAHCCGRTYGEEAHKIARERRELAGFPDNPPSKIWVWPQGDELCQCRNCRLMGKENDIHMDNVNQQMKMPPFEHKGEWIPRFWCVGIPWGTNWSNHHDHVYYPPSVLNR